MLKLRIARFVRLRTLTCLAFLLCVCPNQRWETRADRITLLPTVQHLQHHAPCDRSRKVFTEPYGEISDGPAGFNYTQDSHCEWLIKARNDSQFITLTFHSMGTECAYDYIYVYDGDSFNSTLLGSFSGRTQPQRLVARSGSMLILMYSDTNYVLDGFRASYYISNCLNNCHNHGKCVGHQCVCHGEWVLPDCESEACPNKCGESQGRGKCVKGICHCEKGFSGRLCDLYINPQGGNWRWLATDAEGMTPRAAHTAVYLEEHDALYVFGGYDLNNVINSLQIYRFSSSQWVDEWGLLLQDHNYSQKINATLLKAVLQHKSEDEAKLWGLRSDVSFFRNILYTLAESNLHQQRSSQLIADVNANTTNEQIPEYFEDILEEVTDNKPEGRYGHAADRVPGGFVIFGGKNGNGSFFNDLWFYNSTESGGKWKQWARNSKLKPPKVARHTITLAGEYLYLFGGSLETGEFSSKIYRLRLPIYTKNKFFEHPVGDDESTSSAYENDDGTFNAADEDDDGQWEFVHPRGGKSLDVRLAAHSTVYYSATNSLIVFGGIMSSLARFSKLSDRIFAFQLDKLHWTEILYPRTALRDTNIPHERAFHSATISGNYMMVFGGYTHRHNKDEICYDNQMYWYHLSCHIWINQVVSAEESLYPKKQGVFAHAAALRRNNTLLIVGGYHGNVNADLFAYELPQVLRLQNHGYNPEMSCRLHTSHTACLSNPECGWCSADSSCYGRTIGANCTTNLQTTRCPGICPSLGDCHSCLVHGTQWHTDTDHYFSVASKLGLNECTWCVQNAKCHHRDDNYGICGEDTPSRSPGWWGEKGTEIRQPSQCTSNDKRPGLTYIKYHHPVNLTMPDFVAIVNATMVDFGSPAPATQYEQKLEGEMLARLVGFVRPQKTWEEPSEIQVCTSYSSAFLRAGLGKSLDSLKELTNRSTNQSYCGPVEIPSTDQPFLIDFQARRRVGLSTLHNAYQKTKMELYHIFHGNLNAFTFEYLEPYYSGNCTQYVNCLHCLTDSACGWCGLTAKCVEKTVNETETCTLADSSALAGNDGYWEYLITQPSQCANCSNYVSCNECVTSGLCEWWTEEARCARFGKSEHGVRNTSMCPIPCRLRTSCDQCLNERGRCVWCEATSQCFSFAVYTSEYQFGMCREWLDQIVLNETQRITDYTQIGHDATTTTLQQQPTLPQKLPATQCKSCTLYTNCTSCLRTLSCGWCFDRDNPIEGVCMQGDFSRPFGNCSLALNSPTQHDAEWAYAQCPDVDECGLGLHDCHKEAKCTNTHGSYNCHCRRGYVGDGRQSCVRTCYENCVHGYCSGSADYVCKCELGWTGTDCSINCGCNNHSTCVERVGKCDQCQAWTEGERCERCRQGSYGNATSADGCHPCECNGHGNQDLGICNVGTGECYCKDNTVGLKCDQCANGYYGDPRDGGQCYFQCESRGMLTNIGRSGIGSYQSYKNPWGASLEVRECLWILSPKTLQAEKSLLQLEFEWPSLAMDCDENAVYIYDSLPDLTGATQQNQLISVVCSPYTATHIVEARSSHVTVYYKQGGDRQKFGFNALYTVKNCAARSCLHPHICDEQQRCVCPAGYVGARCEIEICPKNCNAKRMQGYCDTDYGRCICNSSYAGADCGTLIKPNHLVVTDLFNTLLLSDTYEHLRKTIPRFGHSVNADRRGSLWMFGGYSPSHGPLNDFRQFDAKNGTWMQVTVESTPDDKMPLGRYFHASEIYLKKQIIFIYGGISIRGEQEERTSQLILDDFWQFSIQNQRWSEIELLQRREKPPALAGHTLTQIRYNERESLILIGGMTRNKSRQLELWEFNLETFRWEQLLALGVRMPVLYGHSTVYSADSHILYVFGGYSVEPQNKLYALNLQKMTWTELPTFKEMSRPDVLLPRARYFHSAATTENYMIIYGGRTHPYDASDVLIAYIYDCNQWIRLTEEVHVVGRLPHSTYAEAISIDHDSKAIYVIGGWDGSASQSHVTRINLPDDICQLWSANKYLCRTHKGCSYCTVSGTYSSASYCFSEGDSAVCEHRNGTLVYNNGAACDDAWMSRRNCSSFSTCSACLASWPTHVETTPVCQWCDECGIKGRCVPAGVDCERHSTWCNKEISVGLLNLCPQPQCHTLHCEACVMNENCEWAQSELGTIECITKELVEQNQYRIIGECPMPCHIYKNCSTCLNNYDENPKDCKWSTMLNSCISPQSQPLLCAGGVCGLVLEMNETSHCPEPCHVYDHCSTCLEHAHCGWCARDGFNGDGICTEGSLENKQEYPSGSTCDLIYTSRRNDSQLTPADVVSWHYVKCPAENECTNGHHNCNPISERCIDTDVGYTCQCGEGYRDENGTCLPVCSQGCVRGKCIKPDNCTCDFGYVGANCSIQCLCNGHSNCGGPDRLDVCLECHNNTKGAQCEKCKPLFVGNPKEGHECVPCLAYCNGHSDVCLAQDSDPAHFNMTRAELEEVLQEGPESNATCLRCANSTAGDRCDTCIVGYFRGSEDHHKACRPCQCHGHGNVCDPVTGEKCNCGNNTESDATCTAGGGKNSAQLCWSVQCSKCRDSYAGNPIDGHQCYKQITVESRMCFDAKPIEECKSKPAALRPGQTVFFVIQPRFMNVDIRIIIDVTQGELDVFMSPQDDSFIVETNETTGFHEIFLDNRYNWVPKSKRNHPLHIAMPRTDNITASKLVMHDKRNSFYVPHIQDCKSHGGHSFHVKDKHAKDLSTHVTLNQCNTLLRLFGLKNRLVLTLPQNAHNLSATRFFIALRAGAGPEHSYGSVVFRQDQLHIDLFVFFSVFFSCFFLFLAVCVVVWKVKQAADLRRARRQHVVEMLHLAKRPFARVFLTAGALDMESPQPAPSSARSVRNITGARSRHAAAGTHAPEILLIAIEPTADNLAAVGTVFVSLPGRHKAPLSMALGSALITYPRQFPLNARNFMRTQRGGGGAGGGAGAVAVGGGAAVLGNHAA
ncbi:multiple epidermal growth factor-like domains protein 8 [Bactrocera dorsalis]|uniref:Multiple epidermal growth factor-like domains protein 8 n=2 Tax=Bactrocera dorsalis TaxID=27457 RepID=A0ABM3JXF1_BACDO|nr:multiple epidermal growth factor-like domains protein 8 [Bactrocera dorsalis]